MPQRTWDAAIWRKSRRSGDATANCVEVAAIGDVVGVRDSKQAAGPVLVVARASWTAFVEDVKSGVFDLR